MKGVKRGSALIMVISVMALVTIACSLYYNAHDSLLSLCVYRTEYAYTESLANTLLLYGILYAKEQIEKGHNEFQNFTVTKQLSDWPKQEKSLSAVLSAEIKHKKHVKIDVQIHKEETAIFNIHCFVVQDDDHKIYIRDFAYA